MTKTNIHKLQNIQKILEDTPYNICLPTLIFLGSQSSGKSSVLERLIHCDILPKGFEISTKCPIEINLRKSENTENSENGEVKEYVMINNQNYTFGKAKTIIQQEMDRLCQTNYISQVPLQIDVYSKDCVEISLVDLPGLTKLPLKGQPKDIEKQILEITMKYIQRENCILLPIIPANADISTIEVLKICKKVDTDGKRTFGVITKIDLMDTGTDCLDILLNKVASLKMGYIGVINRGQSELTKKQNLQVVINKENQYFMNHKKYSQVWPKIGIQYLEQRLQEHYEYLVDEMMPKIKVDITRRLQELDVKLSEYHENVTLDNILYKYVKTLKSVIKEKYVKQDNLFTYNSDTNFMQDFKEALIIKNSDIKFDKKTIDEIHYSNSIFISDNLFKNIVNSYFDSYCINTIIGFDKVAAAIIAHITNICSSRYTKLTNKISQILKKYLNLELASLKKYYNEFAKIHTCCINTSHSDFNKRKILHTVLSKYVKAKKETNDSKYFGIFTATNLVAEVNQGFDVDLIYEFTSTYFECNKKMMMDHAMKSAYYYLVEGFGKKCLDFLRQYVSDITKTYNDEICESQSVYMALKTERDTYQKMLDSINK